MLKCPKARKIFDKMIAEGYLPEQGRFEINDTLLAISFKYYRELFPPKSDKLPKQSEIRLSNKICGLNLKRLLLERSSKKVVSREVVERDPSGFVYIISNPSFADMFKIGITNDIYKRLSTYQTYDPFRRFKIEHYAFVENKRKTEKMFLEDFRVDIVKGEWIKSSLLKEVFLKLDVHFVLNTGEIV